MSEIPSDIMKAALECHETAPIVYADWFEDEVVLCIAKAIYEERKRCVDDLVSAYQRGYMDGMKREDSRGNESAGGT